MAPPGASWLLAGFVAPLQAAWVSVGNLTVPAKQASGTPDLPGSALTLVWGASGCTPNEPKIVLNTPVLPFAIFVERGTCSFETKMAVAVHAGAAALLVTDSLQGEYRSGGNLSVPAAEMQLVDPCVVDCSLGRGVASTVGLDSRAVLEGALSGQCASRRSSARSCPSDACAFSGSGLREDAREVCCLVDHTIDMWMPGALANHTALPALFLSLSDGAKLRRSMDVGSDALVAATLFEGPDPPSWDGAMLLILILGTGTAAFASSLGAGHQLAEEQRRHKEGSGDSEDETLSMTASMAVGFLLLASAFLVTLYFFIRAGYGFVMQLLLALFVVAAASSLSLVCLHPALRRLPRLRRLVRLLPRWQGSAHGLVGSVCSQLSQPLELAHCLAIGLSLALALFWWWHRRATWAWVLQDLLAVGVICSFLRTVRLPSLRVATLLLLLMCAYDIFMVFVSPLLFQGSVMMTVATAGEAKAQVAASGVCERTEAEHMPMLLLVPHLSAAPLPPGAVLTDEPPPSYGMLGLGDVVLPGLLLVFARRVDLSASGGGGRALRWDGYFAPCVLAYACGLAMALAANALRLTVNGVQGQPALLYLVPATLGAVYWRALRRAEVAALWHGSALGEPAAAEREHGCSGHPSDGFTEPGEYKPMLCGPL